MSSGILIRLSEKKFFDICNAITKSDELSGDLYSEVILMLFDKSEFHELPDKELVRLFYGFANRTWNLPNSQFNKKYKRFNFNEVQVEKCSKIYSGANETSDDVNSFHFLEVNEEDSEVQIKNRNFVESELSRQSTNDADLFVTEVTKLYFKGNGVTDIHKLTGVDRSAIRKAINQFKTNARNHIDKCYLS